MHSPSVVCVGAGSAIHQQLKRSRHSACQLSASASGEVAGSILGSVVGSVVGAVVGSAGVVLLVLSPRLLPISASELFISPSEIEHRPRRCEQLGEWGWEGLPPPHPWRGEGSTPPSSLSDDDHSSSIVEQLHPSRRGEEGSPSEL